MRTCMRVSNEFFQDIFRLLGERIDVCGSSAQIGPTIKLNQAIVESYERTEVPNLWRIHFHNMEWNEEAQEHFGKGDVQIYLDLHHGDITNITFQNDMDVTIVRFRIDRFLDQSYLKFKLKHS